MKKMILEILKDSLRFLGFLILFDLLITLIIYQYVEKSPATSVSFGRVFALLFTNQEQELVIDHPVVDTVLMLEKIIEIILTAILTGFIFSRVINREINLKLRNTLLLRKRTSEGTGNGLNIHMLVGNHRKYQLYNVRCTMSIWTGKTIGKTEKGDQFNAAVAVDANPPEVRQLWNYYTFCFPAGSIPSSFWRHYTEYLKTKDLPKATPDQRGHWNDKDRIIVYLFGETGSSGGKFMLSRKYHYKDLVLDKDILSANFNKNEKLCWKYFQNLPGTLSEEEREKMIEEITLLGS